MPERRALVEGLKPAPEPDRAKEEAFVYGPAANTEVSPVAPPPPPSLVAAGRVPLTTRIRPALASALKRASLERQLAGVHPHALQDLVEDALEQWLVANTGWEEPRP